MAQSEHTGMTLNLIGFNDTMRALKQTDQVAAKALRLRIRKAAEIIRDDARSKVSDALPRARNWRSLWPQKFPPWNNRKLTRGDKGWPAFDLGDMRRSIKVSFRRQRLNVTRPELVRTSLSVESRNAALAVYEFAKRSHRSKDFPYVNSIPFVNALGTSSGGRIMWAAFERSKDRVGAELKEAVRELESVTQTAIDKAKDVM